MSLLGMTAAHRAAAVSVCLCVLTACGGRDRDDRSPAGDGGPSGTTDGGGATPSSCETSTGTTLLGSGFRLHDAEAGRLGAGEAETSVALVSSADEGLLLVDRDGARVQVADGEVADASLARRPDGVLCALWAREGDEAVVVEHGCAPGFDVDASSEVAAGSERFELSEGGGTSSVVWFQGDFSSASALVRAGDAFEEVELYESSISWFGDAASADGNPQACLITSGDNVALYGGGGFGGYDSVYFDPNVTTARGCQLVATTSGTYMLAIASTSASLTSGPPDAGGETTPLPVAGVRGFAVIGEQPVVVHERGEGLRLLVPRDGELYDGALAGAGPASRVEVVGLGDAVDVFAPGSDGLVRYTACPGDLPTEVLGADDPFERVDLGTSAWVTAIGAAGDGTIFATTSSGGFGDGQLIRVRDGEATSVGYVSYAQAMHVAGPSDVWIATGGSGSLQLRHYDGSEVVSIPATAYGSPYWIGRANDGTVFVGSRCLMRLSGDTLEEVTCPATDVLDAWMSDADDGYVIDYRHGILRVGTELPEPPDGYWSAIAAASDGTVWLAGPIGAVARLRSGTWEPVATGIAEHLEGIHAVTSDAVWVVTEYDVLYQYDGASWTAVELPPELGRVEELAGTAATGLVVAGEDGVVLRERR